MLNTSNLRGVNKAATGRRMKQLLQMRDTNVKAVSKVMGVSYQCIYRWIRGETVPDIDNLVILSKVLGVNLETVLVLYGEEEEKEPAEAERMWAYYEGLKRG